MKFLNNQLVNYDLTYSDVFLVPNYSDINSRFEVSLQPQANTGASLPIVVANMSAVAGKRMSETVARRGGLVVLPQDIPITTLKSMIDYIKACQLSYDTALTLRAESTIAEALTIIHKRAHNLVVIVDQSNKPIGVFRDQDHLGHDQFSQLSNFINPKLVVLKDNLSPSEQYSLLNNHHLKLAPVVNHRTGRLIGITGLKNIIRSDIYQPAVDKNNKLIVAVAIGINGSPITKAQEALSAGADLIVIDTAHGHQAKMLQAIESVRSLNNQLIIIAGNVVTAQATKDLLSAGANIVKVGVGPGAMCTTRMMTAVGRPQFSSVYECANEASRQKGFIWADGGIKYPRDVALALAAGADSVMIGSWFAATYESPGDLHYDNNNQAYKENYGMASSRAVQNRNSQKANYDLNKKLFFEEGISTSKLYIDPLRPSVEDLIDQISAGLRSAFSYTGAHNLKEFQAQAVVGIQSASGYDEGKPTPGGWL